MLVRFPHTFIKYEEPMKRWARPEEAIIHVMQRRIHVFAVVKSVDGTADELRQGRGSLPRRLYAELQNKPAGPTSDQSLYFVENVFEDLDAPGRYFDRTRGALYFKPPQGIDPQKALIEASCLKQLIEFRERRQSRPTITFSARFAQRSVFLSSGKYPPGDWSIYRGGAVYFDGAEDCTIKECFSTPGAAPPSSATICEG